MTVSQYDAHNIFVYVNTWEFLEAEFAKKEDKHMFRILFYHYL